MNTNGTESARRSADQLLQKLRAALARVHALPPAERERRLIVARLHRLLGADIQARVRRHAAMNLRAPAPRREGNVIDFIHARAGSEREPQ